MNFGFRIADCGLGDRSAQQNTHTTKGAGSNAGTRSQVTGDDAGILRHERRGSRSSDCGLVNGSNCVMSAPSTGPTRFYTTNRKGGVQAPVMNTAAHAAHASIQRASAGRFGGELKRRDAEARRTQRSAIRNPQSQIRNGQE